MSTPDLFANFSSFQLTTHNEYKLHEALGFIYAVCYQPTPDDLVPFYGGQTTRLWGRVDDYARPDFNAATDFKVGIAVRHLLACGFAVVVKYKAVANRNAEEETMLRSLREQGFTLLNDLRGYDYRTADQAEEQRRIKEAIDIILQLAVVNEATP